MKYFIVLIMAMILVGCTQSTDNYFNITGPTEKVEISLHQISPNNGDSLGNPVVFKWNLYPGAVYYVFNWSQDKRKVDELTAAKMKIYPITQEQVRYDSLGRPLDTVSVKGDTVFVSVRGFGQGTTHYWRVTAFNGNGEQIAITDTWKWYTRIVR